MRTLAAIPPLLIPLFIWVCKFADNRPHAKDGWKPRHVGVEVFAGAAAISKSMSSTSMKSVPFDILYTPDDNIMSATGFTIDVELIMQTQAGGM